MKMYRCAKCQRRRPRKKLYLSAFHSGWLFCWAMENCTEAWGKAVDKTLRKLSGRYPAP